MISSVKKDKFKVHNDSNIDFNFSINNSNSITDYNSNLKKKK